MNADEIVKNLRAEAQFQKDRFSRFLLADAMSNAADLIESLQAQLDATPTIHGKWKWYEEWSPSSPNGPAECQCAGYECSVCGISLSEYLSEALGEIIHADNFEETPQIAHCPSCGADMR
jgi:rubredoxin